MQMDSHDKYKINSSHQARSWINNIPVIYEDNWLLVLDKPSGLLTIPAPKKKLRTLSSILNEDLKSKGVSYRLHPCHRLDRETSGLIIYAKGKSIQRKIMQEFKLKKVKKTYIAFVEGRLPQDKGRITHPIDNRSAITEYKVTERRKGFSIVELAPITGRTNQIRIHLKQINHPILGETRYAFRRDFKIKARRLCLHAKALEFVHPVTKQRLLLYAELPVAMQDFLSKPRSPVLENGALWGAG